MVQLMKSRPVSASGLALVVPVYGCESALASLVREIADAPFEPRPLLVLVQDGPVADRSLLLSSAENYPGPVKFVELPHRQGQHSAIAEGLAVAEGKNLAAVVMDCDGQDDPLLLPSLIEKSYGGEKVVIGRRLQRMDSPLNRITSEVYRFFLWVLAGRAPDSAFSSFCFLPSFVVPLVRRKLRSGAHLVHALIRASGNDFETFDYSRRPRHEGRSSYELHSRLTHAVSGIVSWSTAPLRRVVILSSAVVGISSASIVFFMLARSWGSPPEGWLFLVVLQLISVLLIMTVLGVFGLYLENIVRRLDNRWDDD